MESITAYIDLAKTVTNARSDSNLAHKIGVHRQSVCDWRKGKCLPSEDVMLALAERAKLDPAEALILLGLWRSHGETKAAYARALRMVRKTSAYVILASLAYGANMPKSAVALGFTHVSAAQNDAKFLNTNHYAKIGRMFAWLRSCILKASIWIYTKTFEKYAQRRLAAL